MGSITTNVSPGAEEQDTLGGSIPSPSSPSPIADNKTDQAGKTSSIENINFISNDFGNTQRTLN